MSEGESDVVIRDMTIADYASVVALWKAGDIPHRLEGRDSKKNIQHQLGEPTSLYLVAEKNGNIVGVVFGTHDGRKGWINRLTVAPGVRHQGIAKRLVEEVEHRLARLGIDIIACLIEDQNAASMQVFERLGYHRSDIRYFSKRKSEST